MDPLPGAFEFSQIVREKTQLVLLSDTFEQFALPLMKKLSWPALFCNSLEITPDGTIADFRLRQPHGKREAIRAFKSMNMRIFAAGDSFNDLEMIKEADAGCLFRAPQLIREENSNIVCVDTFDDLLSQIEIFLD